MIVVLVALAVLTLLSLGASVLTLSSTGHLHSKVSGLQAQIAETFHETQFQSRVTRKALLEEVGKVLETVGYRPPEPTAFEKAVMDLEAGREPVIDFSTINAKRLKR